MCRPLALIHATCCSIWLGRQPARWLPLNRLGRGEHKPAPDERCSTRCGPHVCWMRSPSILCPFKDVRYPQAARQATVAVLHGCTPITGAGPASRKFTKHQTCAQLDSASVTCVAACRRNSGLAESNVVVRQPSCGVVEHSASNPRARIHRVRALCMKQLAVTTSVVCGSNTLFSCTACWCCWS